MTGKFFGTDGIRGQANSAPMNAQTVLKAGMAAGSLIAGNGHRNRVVIGKDTRLSGYMIEQALSAGFLSAGVDVFLFGPLPTPAVAMLTRSLRADLGVMISASHNPYSDNGIKLFNHDGYKLNGAQESKIERLIAGELPVTVAVPFELGRAKRIDDAQARYIEFAKRTLPKDLRLDGLRIVIDCANGAGYRVAPTALWELGAEVFPIGVEPDGFNINEGCGSTAPERMAEKVRELRADIGIALDGDADRVILADERGRIIDGDQVMALIGSSWHDRGNLRGNALVATVMSNLGLERYLDGRGIALHRTSVGDRHVVEHMRAHGLNVGGEQSGHIILSDFSTTGDGLIAALQVLAVVVGHGGKPVSEVCHLFEPVPQVIKNVRYAAGEPLEALAVKQAIADAEAELGAGGRLVVRSSGTEPLIRVMAEGNDSAKVNSVVDGLVSLLRRQAA